MESGVLRSLNSGPAISGPTIMMITDETTVRVKQQPIALESSSLCLAPKNCDTMMLAPTEIPMNMTSIRLSMGPALPTAASALSPTKRPTMMLSTVLYSCCAILPTSIGNVKVMILLTGSPSVMSTGSKNCLKVMAYLLKEVLYHITLL